MGISDELLFCKCGCGNLASPGKYFVHGHYARYDNPMNHPDYRKKSIDKTIERNKTNHPMSNQISKQKYVKTMTDKGVYEKMKINNPMQNQEIKNKSMNTRCNNGEFEKARIMMKDPNHPSHSKETIRKRVNTFNSKKYEEDFFYNTPEWLEKITIARRKWAHSEEGSEHLRKNRIKIMQNPFSFHIWEDVNFLSKEEMKVAQIILDKPVFGYNCHVEIGTHVIDFFPQLSDKYFIGCFVEYHPCPNHMDERTPDEYYQDRCDIINNSEFSEIPLILITSLKELKKEVKYE